MNLEYTIDLDGLDFVKGVTNYSSLQDHRLTHRDKLSLKIRFTRSGVCQDVGTVASAHFTVKKINEQEEVLSDDSTVTTWTETTSGTDVYYTHDGVIDLDTVELETWIGSQQTCKAEVQFTWTIGTQVYHTRLLKTTIDRALYPATVNPTQATDPQRSWVTILQNVDMLPGDADTGNDYLDEVVTVGLQVPRWYQFVRASDEVMYYYELRTGTDAESVPDIVRPNDYHAVTNPKVFEKQVAAYSGGNGLVDSANATTVTITPVSGTAAVLVSASATDAGILIAADKVRLDAAIIAGGSAATLTDLNATQLTSGVIPDARMPNLTGDVTTVEGAVATTLATVNGDVGSFGSATQVMAATVNAKGLVTAASAITVTPAESSVTFTDITTNNATSLKHGFLPKLSGSASDVLKGDGSWGAGGGGGGAAWGAITGTLTDQTDLVAALADKLPMASILVYATAGTATEYATLALAKAAATSGQLIVVGPGTYAVTASILKNGVNWHFAAGATVTMTSTDGTGILDDGGTSISCVVSGSGNFSVTAGAASASDTKVINTSHASSDVVVSCNNVTVDITPAAAVYNGWAVSGINGTLHVVANDVVATGDTTSGPIPAAVYWESAEMSVVARNLHGDGAGVYYTCGTAGRNMFITADDISVTSSNAVATGAIFSYGGSAVGVSWINAKTINAYSSANTNAIYETSAVAAVKHYVTAQKLFGLVRVGAGSWYISADKISAKQNTGADYGALFLYAETGGAVALTVRWNVKEHQAETFTGLAMSLAAGTVIARDSEYTSIAGSNGVSVSGATATFIGGVVNTTANSSTDSFAISSGTLTLIDTTAVSESTRKDIAHSGGTCTVGGGYGSGTNGVFDVSGTVAFKHPALIDLTSWITGTLPVANGGTGITSLGTGVATALGINVGSAGAFVALNGALGTPSSGTLTSCTGLPISTGVSGLGTGVATFLATPTIANLNTAVSDADLAILGANTFVGAQTISTNGAASVPPLLLSGTIMTGGTGTTNFPNMLVQPTGATAATTWNTNGTAFGINLNTAAGNYADFKIDGVTTFKIDATSGAASVYTYGGTNWAVYDNVGGTLRSYEAGGVWYGTNGFASTINGFGLMETYSGLRLKSSFWVGWSADSTFYGTNDLIVGRKAAATLQLGADAAGVTNQTLTAASRITSDGVGANLTIAGGNGRGGAGGSLIFSTYTTEAATTIGTLTTRLTINTLGEIIPVLPTSAAGLTTGALWNNLGIVTVA